MNYLDLRRSLLVGALSSVIVIFAPTLVAAEVADDEVIEEVVVTGDLNSLPGEDVKSIFGFNKSILETPRSVSTIRE